MTSGQEPTGDADGVESNEPDWSRPIQIGGAYYLPQSATAPQSVVIPAVRPSSARYIGSVWWSWGPAHSRLDQLFLSLDRRRRHYLLWFEWEEDGYSESRVVAYMPRSGLDPKDATAALLLADYRGEELEYRMEIGRWMVWSSGLLSDAELMSVAAAIWPEEVHDQPQTSFTDAPDRDTAPSQADAPQLGRIVDELILAEAVLRREAHRALSAAVLSIGGAFLRAAQAVEACIKSVTDSTADVAAKRARSADAARQALEAISQLEQQLPPSSDRFTTVTDALFALTRVD